MAGYIAYKFSGEDEIHRTRFELCTDGEEQLKRLVTGYPGIRIQIENVSKDSVCFQEQHPFTAKQKSAR